MGDWTVCHVHSHHLWLVSTATHWNFFSNMSVWHSDRPATHFKSSLFAFADTSSVTVGADKHLSRLLSTFSAASQGWALTGSCFAAHLHSWDTLLKGLPASHSFMWLTAGHQRFCWLVGFFFLFNPTDSDWTPAKHSWSPFCCSRKHIWACGAATAQEHGTPTPAQLQCSWWQCHCRSGTRDPSVGVRPSITWCCKCRRNRLCGREAEGGRVDSLLALSFPLLEYICTSGKVPNALDSLTKNCSFGNCTLNHKSSFCNAPCHSNAVGFCRAYPLWSTDSPISLQLACSCILPKSPFVFHGKSKPNPWTLEATMNSQQILLFILWQFFLPFLSSSVCAFVFHSSCTQLWCDLSIC